MAAQTIETTFRSYARSVIQEYTAYAKLLIVMEYIQMIDIDESYELELSPSEFYDLERIQLQNLIRKYGEAYNIMSRSGDSGVVGKGIELFGAFLLTEELEIARLERCFPCS